MKNGYLNTLMFPNHVMNFIQSLCASLFIVSNTIYIETSKNAMHLSILILCHFYSSYAKKATIFNGCQFQRHKNYKDAKSSIGNKVHNLHLRRDATTLDAVFMLIDAASLLVVIVFMTMPMSFFAIGLPNCSESC